MPHVADRAVSLGFLLNFASTVPNGYTTADVVKYIIVPATKERLCRYVELPSVSKNTVGPAKYFISHRWGADFTCELVALVAGHFADAADAGSPAQAAVTAEQGSVSPGEMRNAEEAQQTLPNPMTACYASEQPPTPGAAASPSGIQACIIKSGSPACILDRTASNITAEPPLQICSPLQQQQKQQNHKRLRQEEMAGQQQPQQQQQKDVGSDLLMLAPSRSTSTSAAPSCVEGVAAAGATAAAADAAAIAASDAGAVPCGGPLGLRSFHATLPGCGGTATGPVPLALCGSDRPGQIHGQGQGLLSPRLSQIALQQHPNAGRAGPSDARSIDEGGGGGAGCAVLLQGPASSHGADGLAAASAAGSPFQTSQMVAAVAGAAMLLPGAMPELALRSAAAAVGDSGGGNANSATEMLELFGGGDSRSGSLNPLLARPSAVRHEWPHQRFNSGSSRHSTGSGSGGDSFSHYEPSAPLPPTAAVAEPGRTALVLARGNFGGGSSRSGRGAPPLPRPLPPPSPPANASTAATVAAESGVGMAAVAVQGRGITPAVALPCLDSQLAARLTSGRESVRTSPRASSASSCRQGLSNCAAVAVTDRASEASDAAAIDPATFSAAGDVSSSSSRSNSNVNSSKSRDAAAIGGAGGGSNGCSRNGSGVGAAATALTNAELVDRLRRRFFGRDSLLHDTFVWLDVFAVSQHSHIEQQAQDLAQLQEIVCSSQETLLALDKGGRVLTRIWCLYEIWQTVRRKGPEALRILAGALECGDLAQAWEDLDVEAALATVPADRDRILANICPSTCGPELNRRIKQALVRSASLDLESARRAAPRTRQHGSRAHRAGVLLRVAGSAAEGLAAAREAADVFCGCQGPGHPDTLGALCTVAGCHQDLGNPHQAAGVLQLQVLPYFDETYGTGSNESKALDQLGMLYYTLGQCDTAYDLLLAALCRRLRQLLLVVSPAAAAASQLAAALAAPPCAAALAVPVAASAAARGGGGRVVPPLEPLSGEHLAVVLAAVRALVSEFEEGAAARLEEVTAAACGGGGAGCGVAFLLRGDVCWSVELVGLSLHRLGLVQRERAGRCRTGESGSLKREARKLLEASVELLQRSRADHRSRGTLGALHARADLALTVLEAGAEVAFAEQLLRDNLALAEAVYGREHPHTATAANNLAACLKRQGGADPAKAGEALSLYRRCLEVCRAVLGEAHPDTLVVATNLGVLLADQCRWSESERVLTGAVAALPPQLGEGHPDVCMSYRRLAEVLELRHKLFEAEAMYRLTLQAAEGGPLERRDHGLVLDAREGLQRVLRRMDAAARGSGAAGQGPSECCVMS